MDGERSGFEPELGGLLRNQPSRSGFEPELGGLVREEGIYVDEQTCIGCALCAHIAVNTFYVEPDYGRARVFRQDGDSPEIIEEAIDSCPVNCIHSVDYHELKSLEQGRKHQTIRNIGIPKGFK
ncbi:MAG: ferredoxin [Cyanobacteria bacterium P01_H01_bin.15]